MTLLEYVGLVKQRWRPILAAVLAGLAAAAAVTVLTPTTYVATVGLYVTASRPGDDSGAVYDAGLLAQQLAAAYAPLISGERVSRAVVDNLGVDLTPEQLSERVSATSAPQSALLTVTVTDGSPQRALALATGVGNAFSALASRLEDPTGSAADESPIAVTVVEPATATGEPVAPRPALNLAVGALLGLLAGIGAALALRAMDTSVRSQAELGTLVSLPALGTTLRSANRSGPGLEFWHHPDSDAAERYRIIRARIPGRTGATAPVITFTSAVRSEGRTTLVCNVAAALAAAGRRVLVVDADLRSPGVAGRLGLAQGPGLADLLEGGTPANDARQVSAVDLDVLTAGRATAGTRELLAGAAGAQRIRDLRMGYDVVLVDAPPVLDAADAVDVLTWSDHVVLAVRYGRTPGDLVLAAAELVRSTSTPVLGSVLTMAPRRGRTRSPAPSRPREQAVWIPPASTPEPRDAPEARGPVSSALRTPVASSTSGQAEPVDRPV